MTGVYKLPELDTIEIFGTLKWFDPGKGFGFVVPDNGLPDVMVLATSFRVAGFETLYEGSRIHCQAVRRDRGLQAIKILHVDEPAIKPQPGPQKTNVIVVPESDWERAMVKWFNRVRGFGFLTRGEGTPDIFIHMETLRAHGLTVLQPGQIVEVRWGASLKGPMAAEIRAVIARRLPEAAE
jgi:CspA family cold shock protein